MLQCSFLTFFRKVTLFAILCAVIISGKAWTVPVKKVTYRQNPLLVQSALPYQAPRFDLIQDTDYLPAFRTGMEQHLAEIRAIATDSVTPTFANTIVALERSGRLLARVQETFYGVYQANTNEALNKVQTLVAPKLSQHQDAIYLDDALFARIRTLYETRPTRHLTPEQNQLLTVYYQQFVHAGALLSREDKQKLRTINTRLSSLEAVFAQKLVAATHAGALTVADRKDLKGLDDGAVAAAESTASAAGLKGRQWLFLLQNTTQQPVLSSLKKRGLRHDLFERSWNRAERGDTNDTRATIAEIARLRARKAALFHCPDYATYVLYDQMAKTSGVVKDFIRQLVPATRAEQGREVLELQAAIDADGKTFALQPWDWPYYAERVRHARYDLDENEIRPYFELHRVLKDGVFYAAKQLYGITFTPRHDIPVYHPDVMVYEVKEENGTPLGLMYFDYYRRAGKSGGAWMSSFVDQSTLLGTKPVIYNVANFTKAAPGQPELISLDDVVTMFHEFGHALHGLFASQTYPLLSGTNVARDFVEFPSQFNENWAFYPQVFAHYAHHYRTDAPIPVALAGKIRQAERFDQGYKLGEIVAAAMLDMAWNTLDAKAPRQNVDTFEAWILKNMGLDTYHVPPRYRSSTFLHIWGNGYAAGYYAYLWTEMLDQDAFAWFCQHGGLTRANGQRFRDLILSRGHTMDYAQMFRAFYGKDPDIGPMLAHRGFPLSGAGKGE